MPVIHERAEESGLFIKGYIQESGWITWQVSDIGAELLRKYKLAQDGISITMSTLKMMIACRIAYTNTTGTSQQPDIVKLGISNKRMSESERKFYDELRANKAQIIMAAESKSPIKLVTTNEENMDTEADEEQKSQAIISILSKKGKYDYSELFKEWYLQNLSGVKEAVLRKYMYNNLPNHVKTYRKRKVYFLCTGLLRNNTCCFCNKYIPEGNQIPVHFLNAHMASLKNCYMQCFKYYLLYIERMPGKEVDKRLEILKSLVEDSKKNLNIDLFSLYKPNDESWKKVLERHADTIIEHDIINQYQLMLEILKKKCELFPSLPINYNTAVPVEAKKNDKSPVICMPSKNIKSKIDSKEGSEAFLRFYLFGNLLTDKKAYVNSNLYYVYNNLFRVVGRCVLCGKSFKASKELSEHVKLHHSEDLRGCFIRYYASYVKARYNASNSETKRLRQCLSDLEAKIKSKAGISIFEISDANDQEAWSKVVELLPEVYSQSKPQLEGALKTLADYLYMLKNISLDMPLYSNLTISDSSVDYSEVFASYESFLKTIKLIG